MLDGSRLRKIREEKGVSVSEISEYLGVSERAYRYYENGKRDISTETLKNICTFLDVSAAYLLGMANLPGIQNPARSQKFRLTTDEVNIIRMFRALDNVGKYKVLKTLLDQGTRCYPDSNEEELNEDRYFVSQIQRQYDEDKAFAKALMDSVKKREKEERELEVQYGYPTRPRKKRD